MIYLKNTLLNLCAIICLFKKQGGYSGLWNQMLTVLCGIILVNSFYILRKPLEQRISDRT